MHIIVCDIETMKMRSGVVFVFGLLCFLFGLAFYHYVLLWQQFAIFNSRIPVFIRQNPHALCPTNNNAQFTSIDNCISGGGCVTMQELVKGPLAQNDIRILNYIRQNNFLLPPSNPSQGYNLSNPKTGDTSMGQAKMVLRALNMKRSGFFVECGALDGELRSNTLLLERAFGWSGLLIEGDPKNFALLQQKGRKAWSSPACLATLDYPHEVIFEQAFNRGQISKKHKKRIGADQSPPKGTVKAQCFPFFSLLSALNVSHIDYFSLDVEGAELSVLKTIPFDKISISVLSVEFLHAPGGREALKSLMTSKGYSYKVFGEVKDPIHNWANDLVFIHNSLVP